MKMTVALSNPSNTAASFVPHPQPRGQCRLHGVVRRWRLWRAASAAAVAPPAAAATATAPSPPPPATAAAASRSGTAAVGWQLGFWGLLRPGGIHINVSQIQKSLESLCSFSVLVCIFAK